MIWSMLLACGGGGAGDPKPADTAASVPTATDSGTPPVRDRVGCEARHEPMLAGLLADLNSQDATSFSVAVWEGGEVTCRATVGTRENGGSTPPSVDTLYQIGSTTKMFTSVALLQQVQAGRLRLDTPLAEAYPNSEFALNPDWNDQITLHHLLSQQTGAYDYLDWEGGSADSELVTFHEEVYFPNLWLMNPPGAFWNYSNPNFNLAGLVTEGVDGRAWPDLLREDVLLPLGMDRTYLRLSEVEADGDFAQSRGLSPADFTTITNIGLARLTDPASARPAGSSTWSTPTQMLEMARFLLRGDPAVLDESLRAEQVRAQVGLPGSWDGISYGYGVFVSPGLVIDDSWYPTPVLEHGGNTLSFSSALYVLPEHDFAISVLAAGYAVFPSEALREALLTLVDLPPAEPLPPAPWDPSALDDLVGVYDDAYNVGELRVSRDGDRLLVEAPLLESLGYMVGPELEPVSTDVWLLTLNRIPYDVTFVDAGDGGPRDYLVNRIFVGTRTEEGTTTKKRPGPPPRPRLAPSPWPAPSHPFTRLPLVAR